MAVLISTCLGGVVLRDSPSTMTHTPLIDLLNLTTREARAHNTNGTVRWSQRSTWGGALPQKGELVTIPEGVSLLLDESPPELQGLMVEGSLRFARKRLSLSAGWIMVHGRLQIGSKNRPFRHRAMITLTGKESNVSTMGSGTKSLSVMGGKVEIHGAGRAKSWTRLERTAKAGSTQLVLASAPHWKAGDQIVIASTDFDPFEAETAVIGEINKRVVTVASPLRHSHWAKSQSFGTSSLLERAEVGLLSRNILIRGDEASIEDGFGGHVMVHQGSVAHITGVEFFRMGQEGILGRYPVHFHELGGSNTSYLKESSIHHSFNRCVTIHGSHSLEIRRNVAYDTIGHCFFLETGTEKNNVFAKNLGLLTRQPVAGKEIIPSDATPATFWISNPNNILRGNSAAGSQSYGFWYDLNGSTLRTPFGQFLNNTAHSNDSIAPLTGAGLYIDQYRPPIQAVFRGLVSYKNRSYGAWLTHGQSLLDSRIADNRLGVVATGARIENSLIVGESANNATVIPLTLQGVILYGSTVRVNDVTFAKFISNTSRHAGAIGFSRGRITSDIMSALSNIRLVDAQPVYVEKGNDRLEDRSLVFKDADGSLSGSSTAVYFVSGNPIMQFPNCKQRTVWNGWLCPGPYGRFYMTNLNSSAPIEAILMQRESGVSHSIESAVDTSKETSVARVNLRLNSSVAVSLERPLPPAVFFSLAYGPPGAWLNLSVPYTHDELFVYEERNALSISHSLDQLAKSESSTFYLDERNSLLHLRLQVGSGQEAAQIRVCAHRVCR